MSDVIQEELVESALDYVARGMALTWFDYGQKFPTHNKWNTYGRVITTPEQVRAKWGNGQLLNIGLVHGLSPVKTCSLDVDKADWTRAALLEFGIELDALRQGVPCIQGNPANFRLEYRQPQGMNLPLCRLQWPNPDDAKKKVTVFELRAGPNQDVLPPSKHPDGQSYIWLTPLPENPADHPEPHPALLELWRNWEAWEPELKAACPWAKPQNPKVAPRSKEARGHVDVIGQFNQTTAVRAILETHGYKPRGKNRYLPPNSTSGVPSVRVLDSGHVYSSNGSCPLNDGHAHDAFDCYRILAHGGGWTLAVKAAAQILGIDIPPPKGKVYISDTPIAPPDRSAEGNPGGKSAKAVRPQSETARSVAIQCVPGELPEMVDKAESALCKFEANFYQRSGQLVRWCMSHAETVRGITRPGGAVIILAMDADYLMDRLNRIIGWERWNEDKEDYVPCNAPRPVASTLLARRGSWKAQPLVAAINAPTLRPDGSILDAPGYDAATGLLFVNTAVEFDLIPQRPTREQAATALAFLFDEVLSGFPFAAPHDRSAALSAILTAMVRHGLKNAPMHIFNAPVMASGKSLLADVVALIATGQPATVMSYTQDGDEMRKRVLSVLMQGDLVVNLDNVEEPLASQTLCTVLTQESFTDRILGVNKTGTAPTLCCWIATGNNLVVAGDLTTRIVPCNLDPQVERPEEREFQRNLYDWIPANRPALIQAGLTVLRAYIVAGKPKQPIKNFARFEDWSGLVRSALVWLGEADPLTGRDALEDGDPVRVKLRALLLAWFAVFKTAPATSKEAVIRANESRLDDSGDDQPAYPAMKEALEEHFQDRKGGLSSNAIGYFLRQYAGRIIAGARFEAYGGNAARSAWRIAILHEAQFKREREKVSTLPEYPNHPKHPNPNPHPNPTETAGNPHSTVAPPTNEGWDAWDGWDVSPGAEILPEEMSPTTPLACTWNSAQRLVTKCAAPDVQRDSAGAVVGCKNCGGVL